MQAKLKVFHTANSHEVSSFDDAWIAKHNLIHWKTCIRQIIICFDSSVENPGWEDEFSGAEAYKFILEIISGLHSKVLGETEILGQFKILSEFYRSYNPKFWDSLLKDAKFIRANYLKDYGVQSYGGAARKKSEKTNKVHLIGSGHLAESILHHFAGFKKGLGLYCRNSERGVSLKENFAKLDFDISPLEELRSNISEGDLILVAAPVETAWLENNLSLSQISSLSIMDFRSKRDHKVYQGPKEFSYIDLDEIFAKIEKGQTEIQKRVFKVKNEILNKSLEWDNQKIFRPFGWEDICVL